MANLILDRLCIYFFYDRDGIVDPYVIDVLTEMAKHSAKILVVSNSKLTAKSRQLLKTVNRLEITERQNIGFDVWAYKHGIDKIGWRKLAGYDEVILMNFTIVGPLYPFQEMFSHMDKQSVDFWGINVHSGENYDPWGTLPEGYIPKHIQSHFIALRKSMITSPELQSYWNNMRPINSYQEAIGYHEAIFTQKFARLGFKWDSYVQTNDLDSLTSYPLMFMPREVIVNRRSPVFKRKALLLSMNEYVVGSMGLAVPDTLSCIQELGYDISRLLPNILRNGNQYDVRQALNATHIYDFSPIRQKTMAETTSCVVVYLDGSHKYQVVRHYIQTIAETNDIKIILNYSPKTDLGVEYKDYKNISVNRGTYLDYISAVQTAFKDYNVVGLIGMTTIVGKRKFNLSKAEYYQYNLRALFEDPVSISHLKQELFHHKIYGGFASPHPIHYDYAGLEQRIWVNNFNKVKQLLSTLKNTPSLRKSSPPLSSPAGIFWINSNSLSGLKWSSLKTELKKLKPAQAENVFNCSLPYLLQQNGKLLAFAMNKRLAENYQTVQASRLADTPELKKPRDEDIIPHANLHLGTLYLAKNGRMSEKTKILIPCIKKNISNRFAKNKPSSSFRFEATIPWDSNNIRFDPVEHNGVICKGMSVKINHRKRKAAPENALSYGKDTDIFITSDSQYTISGKVAKGDKIVISFDSIDYYSDVDFSIDRAKLNDTIYGGALQKAITEMHAYYEGRRSRK